MVMNDPIGPTESRNRVLLAILVIGITSLFIVGAAYIYLVNLPASNVTPSPPPVNASLSISSTPVGVVSPSFWGLNVRADEASSPATLSYVASTPVKTMRWPGGDLAERYNMTANSGMGLVYNDNGSTIQPAWTTAQFVNWCVSISCQAIFTVPAEIDDPALAASYVSYVETTLDFHPAYWEIGNEPALWDHFGIPWTSWASGQLSQVTPMKYAEVVHAYISAMKIVDPTIRIIGLGGVGTGGTGETTWITGTVSENGPNLTAVAIHVYPAGGGTAGETNTAIYSSITGADGLTYRIPLDLAAIRSACPSCHIQIMVDEFNAASGSVLTGFMSGFSLVPFVTTELLQGICLNVSSMEIWDLESGYPGSLFGSSGVARPISILYSAILPRLDPEVLHITVTSTLSDVYALATENVSSHPSTALLIANLNTTYPANIKLAGSGFPLNSSGTVWLWSSSYSAPQSQKIGSSSQWVLPPESIGLWVGEGSVSATSHGSHMGLGNPTVVSTGASSPWVVVANGCRMSAMPTRIDRSSAGPFAH
jgi:hypothetical protein